MKKLCFVLGALLFFSVCCGQGLNGFDGPYVSYRAADLIVRSINSQGEVTIDFFKVSEKRQTSGLHSFFQSCGLGFYSSIKKLNRKRKGYLGST
jgi:hypothetical protein